MVAEYKKEGIGVDLLEYHEVRSVWQPKTRVFSLEQELSMGIRTSWPKGEQIDHIQSWIPGEHIDLTVLASYLKEFIDDTATVRQSRSPEDRDKTGFTVSAQATISVEGLRDMIADSERWAAETESCEYRRDPHPYTDSDTWIARKRSGPSSGHKHHRTRCRIAQGDTPIQEFRRSGNDAYNDSEFDREYSDVADGVCDSAAWRSWTRHTRGERLFEPNIADMSHDWPPCLTQERCGVELLASTRGRSWFELRVLFRTLHIAATAQERLHEQALYEAVMIDIADGEDASENLAQISAKGDSSQFMGLCQGVLSTAEDGGVEFCMQGMRHYLLRSNLPEVNGGHETISRICLRKLGKLASMLIVRPWTDFRQLLGRCSPLSLVDYVLRYWPLHYRLSESLDNDLPALLHQTIEVAVENVVSDTMQYYEIELRRETLNFGLYMCNLYGFTVLEGIYKQLGASNAYKCPVQSSSFPSDISIVHGELFGTFEDRNSSSEELWTDLTTNSDSKVMRKSPDSLCTHGRDGVSHQKLIVTESTSEDLSRDVCSLHICDSGGGLLSDIAERWVFVDPLDAAASLDA